MSYTLLPKRKWKYVTETGNILHPVVTVYYSYIVKSQQGIQVMIDWITMV